MKKTKTIGLDKKGYYYRNLGKARNRDETKLIQPKFLLGRDQPQARERLGRLEQFWELVKQHHEDEYGDGNPLWDDVTLDVAKAIGRGEYTYSLPRRNSHAHFGEDADWADSDYAGYLHEMQQAYPVIGFLPEDEAAFQNGVRKNFRTAESHQVIADSFARDAGQPNIKDTKETLYLAIRAYVDDIENNPKYRNLSQTPGSQPLTAWAYKLKTVCLDFINRYEDRPLSNLGDLESIQSLYNFWRSRPPAARSNAPIAKKTAKHRMTGLTLFFKWLHKTNQFSWRKPMDFDEIERSINETNEERAAKARPDQSETFSDEELVLLYRNTTTPLERLLILLGLNCGFKPAEAGTLQFNEVVLNAVHPFAERMDYASCDSDSFVKRIRQKSGVYGEFKLWPHTVLGLKWLIDRRREQTKVTGGQHAGEDISLKPSSVLLVNKNGYPMYRHFKSGNPSQDIAKCWKRIVEKASTEEPRLSRLTFSALRKTAADFIRRNFHGEVASLYLSHGQPCEKDKLLEAYTNKPFGQLFEALDCFAEKLCPMFSEVDDPFPQTEKRGGANIAPKQIREIKRLQAERHKQIEIAEIVGVHRTTVSRHMNKAQV